MLMKKGRIKLIEILRKFNNVKISDKSLIWNTEILEALELKNLILQSIVSIESALKRTESRGAHSRIDYKTRDDDNWMKHSLVWTDMNAKTKFGTRPVQLNTNTKEVASIAPKARVY